MLPLISLTRIIYVFSVNDASLQDARLAIAWGLVFHKSCIQLLYNAELSTRSGCLWICPRRHNVDSCEPSSCPLVCWRDNYCVFALKSEATSPFEDFGLVVGPNMYPTKWNLPVIKRLSPESQSRHYLVSVSLLECDFPWREFKPSWRWFSWDYISWELSLTIYPFLSKDMLKLCGWHIVF